MHRYIDPANPHNISFGSSYTPKKAMTCTVKKEKKNEKKI